MSGVARGWLRLAAMAERWRVQRARGQAAVTGKPIPEPADAEAEPAPDVQVPRRPRTITLLSTGAAAILAALLAIGSDQDGPAPRLAALQPAIAPETIRQEPPAWRAVTRPFPMFALQAPEFAALSADYAVFQRGGDRRDELLWRMDGESAPVIGLQAQMIAVSQNAAAEAGTVDTLFTTAARSLAPYGLSIQRLGPVALVDTKFGPVEAADARLVDDGGVLRACLVFRRQGEDLPQIAGWYCAAADRVADRIGLQCWVDRLDLLGAGENLALKKAFAQAERRRKTCPIGRAAGRKATWLDADSGKPPLKTTLANPPKR